LGEDATDAIAEPFSLSWIFSGLIELNEEFYQDFCGDCGVHLSQRH
jgi:hypothetical protein